MHGGLIWLKKVNVGFFNWCMLACLRAEIQGNGGSCARWQLQRDSSTD